MKFSSPLSLFIKTFISKKCIDFLYFSNDIFFIVFVVCKDS